MDPSDNVRTAPTKGGVTLWKVLLLLSLSCPLLVIGAVFGTRLGLWSLSFGFEVLTLQVGRVLAFVGLAAVFVAAVVQIRHLRQAWPYLLGTSVFGLVSVVGFILLEGRYSGPGPVDVSTDVAQPPVFSRAIMAERRGANTSPVACPGLEPILRQSAPENTLYAMQKAGFTAYGSSAFRADGYRETFWFGQTYHVAIRIRPGRTDVRVAASRPVADGGQSCKLAMSVAEALTPQV